MALSNINYGSGQDSMQDVFDKTNDIVDVVNNTIGTTKGQVLRQRSGTAFDYEMTSEFAYKCAATSASTAVTANYVQVIFTVPENMQYGIGNRVRALASAGNWIEGIVIDYTTTALTVSIDRISGTGSYTSWTLNLGDGVTGQIQSTTVAGTTAVLTGGTISSETYKYIYRIDNKMMHLSFKAVLVIGTGAAVTKFFIPLPDGITKDTTGGASGFIWYGGSSYVAPTSTTDGTMLQVASYDDGTEGQRLKLTRTTDGATTITISNGVTVTLQGYISMPIL